MGVQDLLKLVDPLLRKGNIFALARGRRIGIDGHVILHRLAYHHAHSIVVDNDFGPLARDAVQTFQMILGKGVDVLVVFDGAATPAKGETDQSRAIRQAKAFAAVQYDGAEADPKLLRSAVKLGWQAVKHTIAELRKAGISYIVAPYEADAELNLLCQEKKVWAAVTVDADFIVHGMQRVFFKVNWRSGKCLFYSRELLENPATWRKDEAHCSPFLDLVRGAGLQATMCYALVCGCDYGTKVKGVGPKKAINILQAAIAESGVDVLKVLSVAIPNLARQIAACVGQTFDEEQWIAKAHRAVIVFQNALAYHPTLEKVVTVGGEHCLPASQRWPFLGTAIPDEQAPLRALGLIDPYGQQVQLPPVPAITTPFVRWRLTEDMIPGATLPAPETWGITCRAPTIDEMRDFLRTRQGQPLLSGELVDNMREVVRDLMNLEAEDRAQGRDIRLRDPSGKSLQQHLVESNPDQTWHFPEGGADPIVLPNAGWIDNRREIAISAPALEWHLIIGQFEHRLIGLAPGTRTLLDDAMDRMRDIMALQNFAFHPFEDAPMPRTRHGGNQKSCLFKFSAPASFRIGVTYHVWFEASICHLPGTKPIMVKVLRGGCGCPIGSSLDCVHLLMLMLVVHKVTRPDQVTPCTSLPCAWLNPGHGDTYDVTTPLPFVPFMKTCLTPKKTKKDENSTSQATTDHSRRVLQISESAGWRYRFNPIADRDRVKLYDIAHPERVQLKLALWDAIARAIGQPCAADISWRGLDM